MLRPITLLRSMARIAVDYALPPRCPACGVIVDGDRRFCLDCWSELRFIGPPWCAGCNAPFAYDRGEGALCGGCLAQPPVHDGVRAALAYGAVAKAVVLKLKYGRRIGLARLAAEQMMRHAPADARDWLVVPVPLHRRRLWSRGYNQSLLIARHIAALTGARLDWSSVVRIRNSPPSRGQGRRARTRAVRGAFAVTAAGRERVRGARVLLIDDVYTTGATVAAVAATLKRAGAAEVVAMSWARVVMDEG